MLKLLRLSVTPDWLDRRTCWIVSFLLLTTCTTVVLRMLPSFDVWGSIGLVASVALAWVIIGGQLPRMMRV